MSTHINECIFCQHSCSKAVELHVGVDTFAIKYILTTTEKKNLRQRTRYSLL